MQRQSPKVYVVDDDEAVLAALGALFESVRLEVETFSSAEEFLKVVPEQASGCLVLDVRLPGLSGLELQRRLAELDIRLPVLIISAHADVPMTVRALKAGAVDFLEKPFNEQELLEKVQGYVEQDTRTREDLREIENIRRRLGTLTPREREILSFMVDGKPSKLVATTLQISPKTVDVHRSHVLEKMGVNSIAELVKLYMSVDKRQSTDSR